MSSIDGIAGEYVARAADLDPLWATYIGVAGSDHDLADLSADGFAERAALDRSTLVALDTAEPSGLREQIAWAAMRERLAVDVERYEAGDTTSEAQRCRLLGAVGAPGFRADASRWRGGGRQHH